MRRITYRLYRKLKMILKHLSSQLEAFQAYWKYTLRTNTLSRPSLNQTFPKSSEKVRNIIFLQDDKSDDESSLCLFFILFLRDLFWNPEF